MSHFTVLIIGENPEEQLKPFDENLEVPRYVKLTKAQAIEKSRQSILNYKNGMYAEFLADPEKYKSRTSNDSHLKYLEEEFPKKLTWTDDQLYAEAIKYEDAKYIGPDGGIYSEYNPQSKWDWYQLGGRWAGMIKVKDSVEFDKPNFSWGWDTKSQKEVLEQPLTDSARVKDIANLKELKTFAVIKDGEWFERGEMGWWGMVSNEKDEDEWGQQIEKLLDTLDENTLLSVYDCHI